MSEFLSIERQQQMLQTLHEQIQRRAEAELAQQAAGTTGLATAEKNLEQAVQEFDRRLAAEQAAAQQEYETAIEQTTSQIEAERIATQRKYDSVVQAIENQYASACAVSKNQYDESSWLVASSFDEAEENSPKYRFEQLKSQTANAKAQLAQDVAEINELNARAFELLEERLQSREFPPPVPASRLDNRQQARERFTEAAQIVRQSFDQLTRQKIGRLFVGFRPAAVFFVVWMTLSLAVLAGVIATRYQFVWPSPLTNQELWWMGISLGGGLGICTLLFVGLHTIGSRGAARVFLNLQQAAADARHAQQAWLKFSREDYQYHKRQCEMWFAEIAEQRDSAIQAAEAKRQAELARFVERRDTELQAAHDKYPAVLAELNERRQQELASAEEQRNERLRQIELRDQQDREWSQMEHSQAVIAINQQTQSAWETLATEWQQAIAEFQSAVESMNNAAGQVTVPWEQLVAPHWQPPTDLPAAVPIGEFDVDLAQMENGIPVDARLVPEQTHYRLPAVLPFPELPSLLMECTGAGREMAVDVMQAAMLRLLTSLPPGKIRFTIIDPVGLGENFAAFMHLADYDELLITNRIWTEPAQIEQRLSNLTEHMEDVLQTYLRNEFQSIEEYNHHAGEVAEPYQFLVIANFPANFTENAARRLISIANSGARCGVYLLASVDSKLKMPPNFDLADLRSNANNFRWIGTGFRSTADGLADLPLNCAAPPAADVFSNIVRTVGHESKDARRVEVPFSRVAPRSDQIWKCDSRRGVDVPLGRAGATKLQFMRLGKGTSQHVLVAGKTGSGKSTLLHALITNLGLYYSPQEIEFYLIDFKKGVEFKTYATHGLPHARVIAIESDREFGVSALEKLDQVLKERGDLFRGEGVQDIAAFRDAKPEVVMPRIVLIIDEFQEFFVEDDPLAQTASLLLDRLVRQGRAFGIHVLLGSQTLGGAYSLARSTLGQMAVRVALQCSDADAHMILSEENTAARLLTRPGEAIYNDANGLVEGNHPFQVVWLDDAVREKHLLQISQLAREHDFETAPPVVFEGNVLANPNRNHDLTTLLQASGENVAVVEPKIWLGEAVSIKAPAVVTFRRHSGANLLIVGHSEDSALGIMSNSLFTLAAQQPPVENATDENAAQFYILDGSTSDQPATAGWPRVTETTTHRIRFGRPKDTETLITEISAEIARREAIADGDLPPIHLFVFNLGRFRELRKGDDDYGFSSMDRDTPLSVSKQFAEILKNGPSVGIHTTIWSDTYNNVSRWLSPQTLRELEMRAIFQMNATDSANLVDSPAAGRLGTNRALLYLEETGSLEKFRPYGPPTDEWLDWVGQQFRLQSHHA